MHRARPATIGSTIRGIALLASVAQAALAGAAQAQTPPRAAEPHAEEVNYLLSATSTSAGQIAIGTLAAEHARDERVRDLARRILAHHSETGEELAGLAGSNGVEPVREIDPVTQRSIDWLRSLDGAAFDAVYVGIQEPALYTAGWIYRREARHGTDPAVRSAAAGEVDANEAFREQAGRLAEELGGGLPEGQLEGLAPEDRMFLVYAMNVELSQVRLGEMAAEKAVTEPVRAFARRMVEEHGRSGEQFRQAAGANGVAPLETVGPVQRRTRDRLEGLSGPAFDREYIMSQVIHHYEWFYRYEHASIHGRDPAVRELAAKGAKSGKAHHDSVLAIVSDWGDGEIGAAAGHGDGEARR